jgi:hypothetical protein
MTFEVSATVCLSDVLDALSVSDLVSEIDTNDLLAEMDEEEILDWVATDHSYSVMGKMDENEVCRFVSSNISMTTLIDNLDPDDKRELRDLLNEDQPPAFEADELIAIRDALTLVKAARAAIRLTSTETIDSALEGVLRMIK